MNLTGSIRLLPSMLVLSMLLGCGTNFWGSSPTPSPSQSPAPIQPTIGTPFVPRFFSEEFDAQSANWEITLTSGDSNLFSQTVQNGFWDFQLGDRYMYVYALYGSVTYRNVRVDVRVENRGADSNFTSIICKFNIDEGWYEFDLSNAGAYHILYAEWEADSKQARYVPLADGESDLIRRGASVNEYAVICKGSQLKLFINGEEARALEEVEYALRGGQVGIGVSSFDALPVRVGFDSVTVSEPKE